ncbi:MAG: alanine racemase [Anaerolineaceae bacterium]|nr:alanine racemase [Anaerolineaceae bacterium]
MYKKIDRVTTIQTPTLILNENQAKNNIRVMAKKASAQNIRFRPHFKTHQSAQIGEWFRDVGVTQITVSSVSMADYFAQNGWKDILIAFPVNIREIEKIREIAQSVHLGLLVDAEESVEILGEVLNVNVDIWVKIDSGAGRAGLWWEDCESVSKLAQLIISYSKLHLRGLLTHAGHTYHSSSKKEILDQYQESNLRMRRLKEQLEKKKVRPIEISVGDTPGCWLSEDLGQVDEIRPGNFIFFDAMMLDLGVCRSNEIAVCVACPVVSTYSSRKEIIVYGGAVHLSKEMIEHSSPSVYGYAVFSKDASEWKVNPMNFMRSLSQEHGLVKLDKNSFDRVKIGDLLYIIPVHSCLVVEALRRYQTLDGSVIETRLS